LGQFANRHTARSAAGATSERGRARAAHDARKPATKNEDKPMTEALKGPTRHRAFCAVELPAELRALAAGHAAGLRRELEGRVKVSWEREEKLHLTLKFFGDVEAASLPRLADALARAASRVGRFELRLQGTGVFPAPSRPSVLWLGLADDTGRLAELQRHVEDECAAAGSARDARPFHPHVTIARVREVTHASRALARRHVESGYEPASFAVGELVLMLSRLGPGGSTYTPHSRHPLAARA
jgi:RNA 2',3'-cyclic 3'-phosphodiesterase